MICSQRKIFTWSKALTGATNIIALASSIWSTVRIDVTTESKRSNRSRVPRCDVVLGHLRHQRGAKQQTFRGYLPTLAANQLWKVEEEENSHRKHVPQRPLSGYEHEECRLRKSYEKTHTSSQRWAYLSKECSSRQRRAWYASKS